MDKQALVHKRKKRYMAQVLDAFDKDIAPQVSPETAEDFKGIVRRKLHALALDSIEFMSLKEGEEVNLAAIELRDRMHPEGRPIRRTTT